MKIKQEFANLMDEATLKDFHQRDDAASPENLAIFENDVQEAIMGAVFAHLRCEPRGGEVPNFYDSMTRVKEA